jgi:hypothetical protein
VDKYLRTLMIKLIRKLAVLLLLSICSFVGKPQQINTGISMDFLNYYYTKFSSDVFFSPNSYKAYNIRNTQTKMNMGVNMGVHLILDYSRFFINTKFAILGNTSGVVYKYSYPISGNKFRDYYSKIEYQQLEVHGSLGYFLSSKKLYRPYIEAGFGRAFPYLYTETVYDSKSYDHYYSGMKDEMKELMGLNKQYNFILTGLGYRGSYVSVYLRYIFRLGYHDVYFSYFTFGVAAYTKFSRLRKHYIFQPPE